MLTLAADTTEAYGSIALADDNGVREEVLLHAPQGFSHVLFGEIEALLTRQNVRLPEIDLFAAAAGPGSFTGVRVGLAAIKGLAEVCGKRVVAVSNLEVLAEYGKSDARAVVIDAHRGEVYAAVYDRDGKAIVPEAVLPFAKFLTLLPAGQVEWISAGPLPVAGQVTQAPRAVAGAIATMAMRRASQDPAAIEAVYVRRSDAEIFFRS
jgi:tRNA threonylcarbamoyladenosine biosynthesis protein TsaB